MGAFSALHGLGRGKSNRNRLTVDLGTYKGEKRKRRCVRDPRKGGKGRRAASAFANLSQDDAPFRKGKRKKGKEKCAPYAWSLSWGKREEMKGRVQTATESGERGKRGRASLLWDLGKEGGIFSPQRIRAFVEREEKGKGILTSPGEKRKDRVSLICGQASRPGKRKVEKKKKKGEDTVEVLRAYNWAKKATQHKERERGGKGRKGSLTPYQRKEVDGLPATSLAGGKEQRKVLVTKGKRGEGEKARRQPLGKEKGERMTPSLPESKENCQPPDKKGKKLCSCLKGGKRRSQLENIHRGKRRRESRGRGGGKDDHILPWFGLEGEP